MAKISHRDVLDFYKNSDRDLVELVHELGGNILRSKQELSEKISTNLKKARAARKPKGSTATPAVSAAAGTGASEVAAPVETEAPAAQVTGASPIQAARARRAAAGSAASAPIPSVPAPDTISSTGVESDTEFERPVS